MPIENTDKVFWKTCDATHANWKLLSDIKASFNNKLCGDITTQDPKVTDSYVEITETNGCGMKHITRLFSKPEGFFLRERHMTEFYIQTVEQNMQVGFEINSRVLDLSGKKGLIKGRFDFDLSHDTNIPTYVTGMNIFLLDKWSNYLIEGTYKTHKFLAPILHLLDTPSEGFLINEDITHNNNCIIQDTLFKNILPKALMPNPNVLRFGPCK